MSPSSGEKVAPAIPSSLSISGTRRFTSAGVNVSIGWPSLRWSGRCSSAARESLIVVKPEVAFLAEADLVADALVSTRSRPRHSAIFTACTRWRARRRVLFAGAEASAQIDVDDECFESALSEAHRNRAADDAGADNDQVEALA